MHVTPNGPGPLHENDVVTKDGAPGEEHGRMPGGRIAGGVRFTGLGPACREVMGAHALRMSHSLTVVSPDPDEASMYVCGMKTTEVMLWGSPEV